MKDDKQKDPTDSRLFWVLLYTGRFIADFQKRNVLLYAAQASYYVILSGVPLVLLLMNSLNALLPIDIEEAILLAQEYLPLSLTEVLVPVLRQFARGISVSGFSVSILTLLWSGSRGTIAIVRGLRHMYGLPLSKGTVRDTILAVVSMFGVFFFILVTIIVLVFGQPLATFILNVLRLGELPNSVYIGCRILFVGILTLAFQAEQKWIVRNMAVTERPAVLLGSFLSALGWAVFSDLFSFYITHFQTSIYGSFGALICFMMWVYWCIVILLCGAIVNRIRGVKRY